MEDTQLTAGLAASVPQWFERCVEMYQPRIYAFTLRLTGNPQDAEEIAQDTFVRAYRALLDYEPERIRSLALRPWLYQIALNIVRNRIRVRRPKTEPLNGEDTPVGWIAIPADEQPEAVALRGERQRELAERVLALPEHFRIAVLLRFVADLSYAEIARLLGHPEGTVKAHVHRGVLLLRESLARVPDEVR